MPNKLARPLSQSIFLLLLLAAPAAVSAQEPTERLDEVVVTDRSEREEEEEIVSGPFAKSVEEFPGSVTVLSEREVDQVHPLSTIDALQQVPGVNVTTEDGRGLRPNIGLRGLDPDRSREGVLILADGVPIQPALYGDRSAYYNVPVENAERIEVIKGASSALYGPGNVGGVVNYITKRPPSEAGDEWQFNETVREGALFESALAYGVTGENGVGTRVSYVNKHGETVREQTGLDLHDFNIRTIIPTQGRGELSLRFNYYQENAETPGGLPVDLFREDPNQSIRSDDKFYGRRISFDGTYTQPLTGDIALDTTLYTNFFQRDWYIADGIDGAATTNTQFLRDFAVIGIEPRIRMGDWIVGTRFHHEGLDDVGRKGASPGARTGTTTADTDLGTFAWASYVQGDIKVVDRLTFTPGIRYEYVDQTRDTGLRVDPDLGLVGGQTGSATTREIVGGGHLNYDLESYGRLYGGVQRTFDPPSFSEAIDPTSGTDTDLDAETAWTYEVGHRAELNRWLSSDLSVFLLDFDNKIVSEAGVLRNGGQTLHRGVELGLVAKPVEEVRANFALTLVDAEFEGGATDGNELPMSPNTRLAYGVSYTPLEPLTLRLDGYYVADQYTDAANTREETPDGFKGELPDYDVWNVRAEYRLPKLEIADRLTLFTGVNNVFDEEYRERRQAFFNGIVPGLTRTFYAGVEARF